MDYLARREHCAAELRRKLCAKGYEQQIVEQQLLKLTQENLLSDQRFAESYVNYRSKKGFGPLRIKQELKEKGLAEDVIEHILEGYEGWQELADEVRVKRFGKSLPKDYKEKARQMRFLQYRGFANEQLRRLFDME